MEIGITAINEKVRAESAFVAALRGELEKVIVGQRYMLDRLLIDHLAPAVAEWTPLLHQLAPAANRDPYLAVPWPPGPAPPRPAGRTRRRSSAW